MFLNIGKWFGCGCTALALSMSGLIHSQTPFFVQPLENITVCPWEDAEFTARVNISISVSDFILWVVNTNPVFTWNYLPSSSQWLLDISNQEIGGQLESLTPQIDNEITTVTLMAPAKTYPNFNQNIFRITIRNVLATYPELIAKEVTLTYFRTLNGTLAENHHTTSQTTHINWQPLHYLNESDIRYSLMINDLTTGMPVDCEDCRFISEPYYSFTPNDTLADHELNYIVSFDYCLKEGINKGVEQLLSLDLKAFPTHENILFKWTFLFPHFGGLELNSFELHDDLYNIQLTDINDSSYLIQDQVSGYTYTFTPKPNKVCSTFNFEVKAADSPNANITSETITVALTDLGEPEISVSQQDDRQVLVQLTSLAPLHRITLSNNTGQIADVVTPKKQLNFSVAQTQQTILVSITPENCPGMSAATTLFVTKTPPMESNAVPITQAIYPWLVVAAVIPLLRWQH